MWRWQIGLIGAVLTALLLAAIFPPWKLTFLAPVALTPLLYGLNAQVTWKARFLTGWLCGFIYWAAVCFWIGDVLAAYGGISGPLAVLTLVLFAIAKGLHMAVFGTLAGPLMKQWWAIPAVAALWTGIERTHGPLGFAWLALGNAGIEMGMPLRLAPFVGVYGLSFVFAALACGLTLVALKRNRKELAWLLAFGVLWALPAVELKKAPDKQAVSLQPSIAGDAHWDLAEKERMVRQMSLLTLSEALDTKKPSPALLLWPEAPAPIYYYQDPELRSAVTELARLSEAPFFFAGVAHTAQKEPLNSALLLDSRGRLVGRYDKRFLVPFGEFIPPGFGWINKISSEAGDFLAGDRPGVFQTGDHTLGVFICYESAFPHLVNQTASGGAQVLVNLTNDGYFGRSAAPREQHQWLARMRAVENNRWLLRSSNDGRTMSIDPSGRVWDPLPEFKRTVGRLRFAYITEKTPYTRFGDWFAWICLALGLSACVWAWLPKYRPATTIDPT